MLMNLLCLVNLDTGNLISLVSVGEAKSYRQTPHYDRKKGEGCVCVYVVQPKRVNYKREMNTAK